VIELLAEKGVLIHLHDTFELPKRRAGSESHGSSLMLAKEYLLEDDGQRQVEHQLSGKDMLMLFDSDMFLTKPTELHYQMDGGEVLAVAKFVSNF